MKISTENGVVDANQNIHEMFKADQAAAEADRLPNARTAAIERVESGYRNALKAIQERYPQEERDGWHELVNDAKQGRGECIKQYANALDINVDQAINRILDARVAYRKAYGKATGILTRLRDQIDAAETIEALKQIDWPRG